jgi:transcriptional regulator with GAF, ATPase, and Fis domain
MVLPDAKPVARRDPMADNRGFMTVAGEFPALPKNPFFSREELTRFAECLTGDADRDQRCFRALLATVAEVVGETDLDTLLRRLVDHTVETTGTERGLLLLLEDGELQIRTARGKGGVDLTSKPVLSRTVPEKVLRTDQPLLARVGSQGEVLDLTRSVASMRLRQVMCAPVKARDRTLGVIYADSTMTGPPLTPADLMLFHAPAGLMGMAIENNRLFHATLEAREMSNQLRVAREIQQRLLPVTPARYARAELAGVSEPSDRVGGDSSPRATRRTRSRRSSASPRSTPRSTPSASRPAGTAATPTTRPRRPS